MPQSPDRRRFMGTMSLAGLGGLAAGPASGHPVQPPAQAEGSPSRSAAASPARWPATSVGAGYDDLPAPVRKEAQRTLLNWVGCAVGGSRHETLDAAIAALAPFSGPPQATVLGRRERLDILHAALMNGISSHVFDFDDTHLKTVIHPAGPGRLGAPGAGRIPPDVGHATS